MAKFKCWYGLGDSFGGAKECGDEEERRLKMSSKPLLNFEDIHEVRDFIQNTETGIYSGKNVDGEKVIVMLSKGVGMDVKTLQSNGWWAVHDYDENGIIQDETFERDR